MKNNEQAVEFHNTINGIVPVKGSQFAQAQAKTIRNMKGWSTDHNDRLQEIRDTNCAVKDVDGVKILLKKTLKRTTKTKDGHETSEEFQVNEYTAEGEKKMREQIKTLLRLKPEPSFEIRSTYDIAGAGEITEYQKIIMEEAGFLLTEEEYNKKYNPPKENTNKGEKEVKSLKKSD